MVGVRCELTATKAGRRQKAVPAVSIGRPLIHVSWALDDPLKAFPDTRLIKMHYPNASNGFKFSIPQASDPDAICKSLLNQIGMISRDAWVALNRKFTPAGGDALMTQALDQCVCGELSQDQLETIARAIELVSRHRGSATTVSRQMFPSPVGRRQTPNTSRPHSLTAPPRASTWPEQTTNIHARRSLGPRRRLPSPSPHTSTASVDTVITAVVLPTTQNAPRPLRRKPPVIFK